MKIQSKRFRVPPGEQVNLGKWPTTVAPVYKTKRAYKELLDEHVRKLASLQRLLYADNRYSLLLVFQAMDAAGKDGVISHIMSGVNPQGCRVYSFKHPSQTELEHDFLWRTTRALPERGQIGIFNRSYYEEVLIARVHPKILQAEELPPVALKGSLWQGRFRSIVDMERHLHRNGTVIVKFFLHISAEEQRKRFLQRIVDPDKNWKFNMADMAERAYWKQYMHAYGECLQATSTSEAPWYAIPADDKRSARLIVSQIILDTLRDLRLTFPKVNAARRRELHEMRALLSRR
ncbi:MAG TPA: ADP-polyphosphate phosphotransferase [Steroidobacteraceae bacterium]|jgi:PPK2 family polyphosphate:nucleotide phosphotransferase